MEWKDSKGAKRREADGGLCQRSREWLVATRLGRAATTQRFQQLARIAEFAIILSQLQLWIVYSDYLGLSGPMPIGILKLSSDLGLGANHDLTTTPSFIQLSGFLLCLPFLKSNG